MSLDSSADGTGVYRTELWRDGELVCHFFIGVYPHPGSLSWGSVNGHPDVHRRFLNNLANGVATQDHVIKINANDLAASRAALAWSPSVDFDIPDVLIRNITVTKKRCRPHIMVPSAALLREASLALGAARSSSPSACLFRVSCSSDAFKSNQASSFVLSCSFPTRKRVL